MSTKPNWNKPGDLPSDLMGNTCTTQTAIASGESFFLKKVMAALFAAATAGVSEAEDALRTAVSMLTTSGAQDTGKDAFCVPPATRFLPYLRATEDESLKTQPSDENSSPLFEPVSECYGQAGKDDTYCPSCSPEEGRRCPYE